MINKLPSHRNCKVCKTRFKPEKIYQWWCNEEHRIEYAVLVMKDKRSRDQASELKRRREKEREEKNSVKS